MKKEKLELEIKNWRLANMAKAREARLIQLREKKEKELKQKLENLSATIDAKVEREVEQKVEKMLEEANVRKLKKDFYDVFYKVGGVKGMVAWIKENPKNRMEYYKLFISLLRSESQKQIQSQQQAVVLNIITPDKKEEYIIEQGQEDEQRDIRQE